MVVSLLRWAAWGRRHFEKEDRELDFGWAELEMPPAHPRGGGVQAAAWECRLHLGV